MRPPKGKQKLFDAAMKLFETQGYFATSVEQITQEAGVSKGLVYNYFKSKEELLSALIEATTARMQSVAIVLEPGAPIQEALSSFIDAYLSFLQSERQFLKLQLTLLLMPELQETVRLAQQKRAKLLLQMVESWIKHTGVAQAKSKARLLLAMLDGVALHYLSIYKRYPLSAMRPHMIQAAQNICS